MSAIIEKLCEPLSLAAMKIQWLPELDQSGIKVRPFRFTVMNLQCGEVTTYGCVASPAGKGPFPAILHIHGGGQTCDKQAVCEWVADGYTAMSFDWTGVGNTGRNPGEVMVPPADFGGEIDIPNAPNQFLGHAAARGCLSILESLPEVDAGHMGIYGISWGGFLTWLVNGTDPRVKGAVAIYGTGGLFREGHIWDYDWQNLTRQARSRWLKIMEPASYIHSQNGPVLHINGTNDFFGGVNVAAELLSALPDARMDFTPNSNHHFGSGSVALIKAFFNHTLRGGKAPPTTPELIIEKSAFDKVVVSTAEEPDANAKTELWFSYGAHPHHSRCWERHPQYGIENGRIRFELNSGGPLWMFIRKYYGKSGISISSIPASLRSSQGSPVPSPILFAGGNLKGLGKQWGTEIRDAGEIEEMFDVSEAGISLKAGNASFNGLLLRSPAAPESMCWLDKTTLIVELENAASLVIIAWSHFTCRNQRFYRATLAPIVGDTICLTPADFKSEDGKSPADFSFVESFELSGVSLPGKRLRLKYLGWGASAIHPVPIMGEG